MNIINNAIDAIEKENGTITIKTSLSSDAIFISIKDTGKGIKDDDKLNIFDPFFTTKEVGYGLGLGLAISYSIIQEHHGEILVKSALNEGTEFIIKIPILQTKKIQIIMDNKYNILYIDDEESNLRVFKNTFRREFNIFIAASADEGMEILKQTPMNVIITDQRMPGKTGLELLEEIHQIFPEIPPHRLMISGYAAPCEINTAFKEFGLYKFISKPWEADELRQIIMDVIQNQNG
jgi:two-component system NtrC family sensor kinase